MGKTKAVTGVVLGLSILLTAPGPAPAQAPTAKKTDDTPARAVGRLVEQLERHPVAPKDAPDRVGLYLLDLADGGITLIADQPATGLTQCGSSTWSHDGRRILFDATPGTQWDLTRLKLIEGGDGRPTLRDLGTGNCPTFSPADDRIAFLSNAAGAPTGVWLMKADGSARRLLGAVRHTQVVTAWRSVDDRQLRQSSPGDDHGRQSGEERSPRTPRLSGLLGPELGRPGDNRGGHRRR